MKNKKGMLKRTFMLLALAVIVLLAVGVFAQAENNGAELSAEDKVKVKDKIEEVAEPSDIAGEVQTYVEEFVEKRGINSEQINKVTKKNFGDLPKEVNIENVNDANLAIYEVDYNETDAEAGEEITQQIYVITYSVEELRAQGDLIVAHDKRQFLHFGSEGVRSSSGFLKTAAGVEGSLERGYVMMRYGSITGISTSLDVVNSSEAGIIEIVVYKNGEAISFGNSIMADSAGAKKDYDVQSNDIVKFEPGDIISAYLKIDGENVAIESDITMIEITTTN